MQRRHEKLAAIAMDNQEFMCYMADVDTYDLLYVNKVAKKIYGFEKDEDYIGKKCYEVLRGKKEPCDFCAQTELKVGEYASHEYYNEYLDRYFSLSSTFLDCDGENIRMEVARDSTKQVVQLQKLEGRLSTEETLVQCIHTLTGDTSEEESINRILEIIGQYYDAERSYYFAINSDEELISNSKEWCNENVKSLKDELHKTSTMDFINWIEDIDCPDCIYIEDVYGQLKDYPFLHNCLPQAGVKSLVTVPMLSDGELIGLLGVHNVKVNTDMIKLLTSVRLFIIDDLVKRRMRESLEFLSYTDSLTGAYNRHKYINSVAVLEKTPPKKLGVLHVDINGLKILNETYGHAYGDEIIIRTAFALKQFMDGEVFRLSGDEFIVFCKEVSSEEFEDSVAKLRDFIVNDDELDVSIGHVWKEGNIEVLKEVGYSDELMYAEKQKYYKTVLKTKTGHRSYAAKELLEEIDRGMFSVYLQGKVELKTGRIIGAEALVRKFDELGCIIPPIKFIPMYEYDRIIRHVDFFVYEGVCKLIKKWTKDGVPLRISVNFSRVTMMEHDIVERIIAICERYEIDANYIDIEVTESMDKMDNDVLERKIAALQQAGFSVSLDDFGAQYSNLLMLTTMDFSEVKFDKSLIDNICTDKKNQIVVKNALQMIKELKTTLSLAEGIEDIEQSKLLNEYGCDHGQGYFFYKPMPAELFEDIYYKEAKGALSV